MRSARIASTCCATAFSRACVRALSSAFSCLSRFCAGAGSWISILALSASSREAWYSASDTSGTVGCSTTGFARSLREESGALSAKTDWLLRPGLGKEKSSELALIPGAGTGPSEAWAQAGVRHKNSPATITKIEKIAFFISFYLAAFYHS